MARILILDNENHYLGNVSASLRRAGIEVFEAECVPSALERARSERPDILVAAEHFSGLDIIDLLEIKRSEHSLSEIGTVVVSPSKERKLECFRLGCDDFITLPADDAELFFRICALLRRIGSKGVRGQFQDISIMDLVQMLAAARRTGRLAVECGQNGGALYFGEGQVCHATFGSDVGEEAFLQILRASQKGGSFVFAVEEIKHVETTIEKRTDHLLLGLANALDEEAA